jgi:hypothetical protein
MSAESTSFSMVLAITLRGDVVDRVLHHPVAHAVPDRVQHHILDLLLAAQLPENPGRRPGIDLPAHRHVDLHPHLLAREGADPLGVLATGGELLFLGREPLDARPRAHNRTPGRRAVESTVPKAWRTPT